MIAVNDFFDRVICIGSRNRPDRAAEMDEQLRKFRIQANHFEAHWKPIDHNGNPNGNLGCTSSHRGVLELVCHHKWARTLVLEDDAMFLSDDFPEQFDAMVRDVPGDWDLLFLGAGYAEPPKRRVNGSVIEANGLMTTSSYGITHAMARRMAPHISGIGPIDSLFQEWERKSKTYIFSPRLMVQRPSFSDLQEKDAENMTSMLDTRHEEMLLDGVWDAKKPGVFHGTLQRRELSEAKQMYGDLVIVGDKRFTVEGYDLPPGGPPWYLGAPVSYHLKPV